jgi:hypothetical protein
VLFLDAILMVPSLAFIAAPGGECSPCEGFSLSETFHFGSLEFVTNQFSRLSLSSFGNGSGATMGPACSEPPLLRLTGTWGPIRGYPTPPTKEGRTNPPSQGGTT